MAFKQSKYKQQPMAVLEKETVSQASKTSTVASNNVDTTVERAKCFYAQQCAGYLGCLLTNCKTACIAKCEK